MLWRRADDSHGITGALPYDPLEYCLLAACTAIAWAFAIELNVTVIMTFRKRSGMYFWSVLISSWGCALHALGFILKFLVGASWLVDLAFIEVGWVAMVSGQAFVLYSRLNLVVRNKLILHSVLAAIIIDGFALHTPTLVFIYGANSPSSPRWVDKFNIMERIQLMGFSIQESVISTIYIVATVKLLGAVYYHRTRHAMLQLLAINFLCIAMDLVLIGLEFSSYYVTEASLKPFIYAIKLKLEFAVYGQLVGFTKATFEDRGEEPDSTTTKSDGARQHYTSPADFFKNVPKVLRKPPLAAHPTIHTHPEELLKANRPQLKREWDSSQMELSPNNLAAALTASAGRINTEAPNSKSLLGYPRDDGGPRAVNRSKTRNAAMCSSSSIAGGETGVAVRQFPES